MTKNAHIVRIILTSFSPQASLPPHPHVLPSGVSVQLRVLLSNSEKRTHLFKKCGISSRPRRFCLRFFWGWHGETRNLRMREARGRNCWGKPCFSGFFSSNSHYSGIPEGGEVRGEAGALPGCAKQKKEPRNEFLSPFCGVLFE